MDKYNRPFVVRGSGNSRSFAGICVFLVIRIKFNNSLSEYTKINKTQAMMMINLRDWATLFSTSLNFYFA